MKKLVVALSILAGAVAYADSTPVMVSLFDPVQAPSDSWDVTGLRLDLVYGDAQEFKGLDLGIANQTRKDFSGLALGGVNIAGGSMRGAQLGIVNLDRNGIREWDEISVGLQLGIYNNADSFCGAQEGIVNMSGATFAGYQGALVNVAQDMQGLQCGFYFIFGVNSVKGVLNGVQIGLVNYAYEIENGIQIGIVNIIDNGGLAPVLPIFNMRM